MLQRKRFFFFHLTFSLLCAVILTIMVYGFWYRYPLSKAVAVTSILMMVLLVDVIIGPLLGLVVYRPNKKSLKFDLSVIILIQIIALLYGAYSLFEARPAWLVFNGVRFDVVRNNEILIENNKKVKTEYLNPSYITPRYVSIHYSDNITERGEQVMKEVMGGVSMSQYPELYQPLETQNTQLIKQAKPLSELMQFNNKQKVNQVLSKYPQADSFVPLKANAVDMTVLIDKKSGGKVVKIVDLRPW